MCSKFFKLSSFNEETSEIKKKYFPNQEKLEFKVFRDQNLEAKISMLVILEFHKMAIYRSNLHPFIRK